jgi:hypothetical protein
MASTVSRGWSPGMRSFQGAAVLGGKAECQGGELRIHLQLLTEKSVDCVMKADVGGGYQLRQAVQLPENVAAAVADQDMDALPGQYSRKARKHQTQQQNADDTFFNRRAHTHLPLPVSYFLKYSMKPDF